MIVFITDELPKPGAAGHLAMNHAILSWLHAEGMKFTILLLGARLNWPIERYPLAPVAGPQVRQFGSLAVVSSPKSVARIVARRGLRLLPAPLVAFARRRRNGADAVLGKFPAPAERRWCAQTISRLNPRIVVVDTIFRAPVLAEPELTGRESVIIAHDVFHRRAQVLSAAGYTVLPHGLSRVREAGLLSRATHITAIQPDEAALLHAMCPQAHVITSPMPAQPCPAPANIVRQRGRLVFIGSDSLPNLDGLRWFLAEIWPALRREGLTLDLIGDCGPALPRLPDGVRALGRVTDLAPVLHRAVLAISPLRAGSGLKIKLLDYARHGLFTVATPASLEGFAADPAAPFIAAGSALLFTKAVLRHAASPPPSEAALAYVARHYGADRAFAPLREILSPSASFSGLANA